LFFAGNNRGVVVRSLIFLNNEDALDLLKRLSTHETEIQTGKMDSNPSSVMGNNDFYGSFLSSLLVGF
jgi:hypothetical protein